jgi:hypothetical protein
MFAVYFADTEICQRHGAGKFYAILARNPAVSQTVNNFAGKSCG